MGKYNYFEQAKGPKVKTIHPVWRGIGLIINLILPIIAIAGAVALVDFGKQQNWPFLAELAGTVRFGSIFYRIAFVRDVANYISSIQYFKALMIFSIALYMLFSSIFAVINAILYRIFGPPRYGDTDAPAPRAKTKRYTR